MTQNLGYITRRAHAAPASVDEPQTPLRGLTLRQDARAEQPAQQTQLARLLPPAIATASIVLTDTTPMVRLSAIASGIGSLRVGPVTAAWWETGDRTSGMVGDAVPVPAPGNRPLVDHEAAEHLVVNLRHVRTLRRLIVCGPDTTVTSFGGVTILNPGLTVTAIAVVHGQLEVRREPAASDIANVYNIGAHA